MEEDGKKTPERKISENWPWLANEGDAWLKQQDGLIFSTWSVAGPNENFSYTHHRVRSLFDSEKALTIKFTIEWPVGLSGKTESADYRVIYMTEPVVGFRNTTAHLDTWDSNGESFVSDIFVIAVRVSGSSKAPVETPWIKLSHNLIKENSLVIE